MKKIEELNSMLFDVKNTLDTAVMQLEDFDAKNLWLNRKLKEEAKAILEEWNANNDPPLPDGEFYRTIKSGEYMCSCGKSYGCSTYSEHIPEEICKNCIIHQQRQTHCYY